jgi:hypothetical protein
LEPQQNDLSTNAQLLKEILENQKNATPTNITKTLRMFTLDEATFINQPNALHGLLHSMFNPVTAQAVFNLFMQMRPKFVQQPLGNGTESPHTTSETRNTPCKEVWKGTRKDLRMKKGGR